MPTIINPDIAQERLNCKLDLDEITNIFYYGKENNSRRKRIERIVAEDEEFAALPHYDFLSKPEKYSLAVRKSAIYVRLLSKMKKFDHTTNYYMDLLTTIFPNEAGPLNLHITMFIPVLRGQCDAAQTDKWLNLALNFKIIGTYVQTELGHGTYLRGIETTATYDPNSEEFIVHSPTLTSTKWWPGGLGKSSTHAVVMADLVISDKHYGMHAFIMQLRSLRDHQPLDGITVGVIGPKFGYDSIDNGFVRFDHVRVPRDQMLGKYSNVSKDGVYTRVGSSKMLYLTMVQTRIGIVNEASIKVAMAATIATREGEVKILDHLAQQQRVLPSISESYALRLSALRLYKFYEKVSENLFNRGDDSQLSELHCLSSCLKAFSTFRFAEITERCRLSCGGHGYSQASGLPKLYVHNVSGSTYEGDNNVLYLQCGRILMKNVMKSKKGKTPIYETMDYLVNDLAQIPKNVSLTSENIVLALKQRARKNVYRLVHSFLILKESGCSENEAFAKTSLMQIEAARSHAHQYVGVSMCEAVVAGTGTLFVNKHNRLAMRDLCELYLNDSVIQVAGDLLKYEIMSSNQIAHAEDRQRELLSRVRQLSVPLVDGFDFTDQSLCSALGRYDGNVYSAMYAWAQQDPLNRTQVHESYKDLKKVLNYISSAKL